MGADLLVRTECRPRAVAALGDARMGDTMSAATTANLTRAEVVTRLANRHDCHQIETWVDIMIAHGVADHAEIDRLEGVVARLERELDALHADMRGAGPAWWETALGAALTARDRLGARWGRLCDSRHRLTTTEQLGIFMVLSACLGVYVRFGR